MMIKIVFLGDIVGSAARQAVISAIPAIRERYPHHFLIVNGENSAGGFGITDSISEQFFQHGVDVITTGNHIWKQNIDDYIQQQPRLLRPHNYPKHLSGQGIITLSRHDYTLVVINLMGCIHMDAVVDNPFHVIEDLIKPYSLGGNVNGIMVDFHAETTSEKNAFGWHLDGRVSCVIGTHTHIPTDDCRILPKGTGFQTDAGMCGDYNSVIGMNADEPVYQFVHQRKKGRYTPANKSVTIRGTYVTINPTTGLCENIQTICI